MEQTFPIQIYQTTDGVVHIDARLEHDTIWLSEQQMATLFGKARRTINQHIHYIYKD